MAWIIPPEIMVEKGRGFQEHKLGDIAGLNIFGTHLPHVHVQAERARYPATYIRARIVHAQNI